MTELDGGRFLVQWRAGSPTLQDELATAVRFPGSCRLAGAELSCGPSGLVGAIAFPWLEGTSTRVVVDVEWRGGARLSRVVTARAPALRVYGVPASGWRALAPIVADYAALGVTHILTGLDHLFFVVALALLVRRGARLVATVTAFTVAHSVSLAVTALGLVRLPAAPVEASIALSIVLVCAECLRPADSLTRRSPWVVAFVFGLLHGLGFAAALLELGLPEQHLPSALFSFNLGVEVGQLAIIAIVIGARRLAVASAIPRDGARRAFIYALGAIAALWSIDRVAAIFGAAF